MRPLQDVKMDFLRAMAGDTRYYGNTLVNVSNGTASQFLKGGRCFCLYFLLGISLGFTPEKGLADDVPILESYHAEFLFSEQGIVKYRLVTEKALHYEGGDRTYPEGIYIEFYESDQKVSMTGRANCVYFWAEGNVYKLMGNVELKSLCDKRKLNTEELHWNIETKTLYTDKLIKLEAVDELLTGEGLVARQDLSYYAIGKPQGLVNVK